MDRVAVTSRAFSRHPILRAELTQIYSKVTFNEVGKLSGDALVHFLAGHDKAIVSLETIDEFVLSRVPELKTVSKYGVGVDNIDFGALEKYGVAFAWQGGVNRRSVSELALGFMLALLRHVPELNQGLRQGRWDQRPGGQLSSRTVGILGCGHIGKDLVKLLQPFECRILVHDIVDQSTFYSRHGVEAVDLDRIVRESDILTLHIPCDQSTRNILSAERLAQMKTGAILINTARGNLVDELALKLHLQSGHLGGAAFDVFAIEPPTDSELIGLSNFLTTPHIGGASEEAILAMGRAAIKGLAQPRPVSAWRESRELSLNS
ncbi:MAG: phosphoglycerate dehydrogenase [Deltaproteobacteria bacterium]|nr:phosphoglycerate dehydrogenase [Deltaproteobacteria bacterium]MBI3294141.1 phosphoglycerate dehydrogenase [Deltaproteobacteria bacterium]